MAKSNALSTEVLLPPQIEEILTDVQVMERLQIKKTTLTALINREKKPLPCSRIKTTAERTVPILRFRWSKVLKWLEEEESS